MHHEKRDPARLARALKLLITITFACNLAVLPLVPGLVGAHGIPPVSPLLFLAGCWQYLFRVWRDAYSAVLTLFLLFCGGCTAGILWQARRVLSTIVARNTFILANAQNMSRAAVCCFLISLAALLRTVWGMVYYHALAPLFTYNALFIPLFLMGGLLCVVMSALFRQATALREENDLTI